MPRICGPPPALAELALLSSTTSNSTGRPKRPPRALICASATRTPFCIGTASEERLPVKPKDTPMRIGATLVGAGAAVWLHPSPASANDSANPLDRNPNPSAKARRGCTARAYRETSRKRAAFVT